MQNKTKFENPFGNIFLEARAQGVDSISAPTLPVDPNLQGPLWTNSQPTQPVTPILTNDVKASLKSEHSGQVNVGENVIISLEITSGQIPVKKFQFTIRYNKTKLKVLDTNYLDTYFTKEQTIDAQTQESIVLIKAESAGSSKTINRNILEIEFEVLDNGSSFIEILATDNQSFILSDDNVNVLKTLENIEIQAGEEIKQFTPEQESPIAQITQIPKSDLTSLYDYLGFAWGFFFLIIGFILAKVAKSKDHDF